MSETELTREGYERLVAELERLETDARREIADAILEARGHGDLSENAEYHAAKDEQAHLETRIAKLRNQISSARVIDASDVRSDRAGVGSHVTVRHAGDPEDTTYQLVGSAEASPADGRLSVESPIGRALLGAAPGDEVSVQTPGGAMQVVVVAIGP
jgi:transcription elongation factor GreA